MRSFERKVGFNTPVELEKCSAILLTERIYRIPDSDFRNTPEWKSRISKIVKLIIGNL